MKPVILASLVSSGSTWVAEAMKNGTTRHHYAYEYFCPVMNWRHCLELGKWFGSHSTRTCVNICSDPIPVPRLRELLAQTWERDGYTFTKEVYLPWHLESFQECGFDIVILRRSWKYTIPPRRIRVMRWYESFYWSLVENRRIANAYEERTPMVRAAVAHYWFMRKLRDEAARLGLRMMHYENLISPEGHEELVRALPEGFDPDWVWANLMDSRQPTDRDNAHAEQWREAFDVYEGLEETYGAA